MNPCMICDEQPDKCICAPANAALVFQTVPSLYPEWLHEFMRDLTAPERRVLVANWLQTVACTGRLEAGVLTVGQNVPFTAYRKAIEYTFLREVA